MPNAYPIIRPKAPLRCTLYKKKTEKVLLLQAQFLDSSVVLTLVVCLKVLQMRAAISNHLQKTTARMRILSVFLKVGRQFVDFLRKQSNLHRRRACISVMNACVLDDVGFYSFGEH